MKGSPVAEEWRLENLDLMIWSIHDSSPIVFSIDHRTFLWGQLICGSKLRSCWTRNRETVGLDKFIPTTCSGCRASHGALRDCCTSSLHVAIKPTTNHCGLKARNTHTMAIPINTPCGKVVLENWEICCQSRLKVPKLMLDQ